MATIMFFAFPEFGHFNPTLKLAKALQHAGHRVCYLGFAEFEEYLRAQQLEFIPIMAEQAHGTAAATRPCMRAKPMLEALSGIDEPDRASSGVFKHVENELQRLTSEVKPDMLLVDFLIGNLAYKADREFGVPSVLVSLSYFETPMLGRPVHDGNPELPVLVLCPDDFDFPVAIKDQNRICIEPSVDLQRKELHAFPWDALDNSKPLIYCSLGSQSYIYDRTADLFRAVAAAMQCKPGWQLLLATGSDVTLEQLGPLPTNVLVVKWAPQVQVLKRAAMMITHGGLGAIKECIFLGVPMVVFPCRWDQPFNAARVAAHGLGVRGNINHISAGHILSLMETIAGNPLFKQRVDAMSKTFRDIEDSGIGVRAVETLLKNSARWAN